MPALSKSSAEKLSQCHPDLQKIFNEVIKHYDCTIVCGHRNKEDQEQAVREGKSKVHFPNSKHNSLPSMAVDAVPYPIDWNDRTRFYHFAGFVFGVACSLGIKLRWGGDWNGDLQFKNEKFMDLPHFELVTGDKNADSE